MPTNTQEPVLALLLGLIVWSAAIAMPSPACAQSQPNGDQRATPPPAPPPVDDLGDDEPDRVDENDPLDYKPELDETYQAKPAVRPPLAGSVALESLGGIGGAMAGTLTGVMTGSVAGAVVDTPSSLQTGAIVGAAAGYAVGPAVGVWLTGNGLNGNGSYLATQAGSLLGAIGGGLVLNEALNSPQPGPVLTLTTMVVLPVAGSVIGYEASNSRSSKQAQRKATGVDWAASLAPSADGRGGVLLFGGRL